MKIYVYAIYNRSNSKIYIGTTNNIEKRLSEHNNKMGIHFTSKFTGRWELIYKEECENRTKAIQREKQLKGFQGRKFIKKSIPL